AALTASMVTGSSTAIGLSATGACAGSRMIWACRVALEYTAASAPSVDQAMRSTPWMLSTVALAGTAPRRLEMSCRRPSLTTSAEAALGDTDARSTPDTTAGPRYDAP